jgi:hypothetical protein
MVDLTNSLAVTEDNALRLTSLGDEYVSPLDDDCPLNGALVDSDPPDAANQSAESQSATIGSAATDTVVTHPGTVPVATRKLPLRQLEDFFLHDENGQACRLEVRPAAA